MLSRLYSKFKKFIKNNYIYMLIILTVVVVFVIPVPYYIDAPGGLINLNEKIFVKNLVMLKRIAKVVLILLMCLK